MLKTVVSGTEKKNGGTPESARQGIQLMLNILERENDGKIEPEFTDRMLKASRDYLARKISRAEASGQPFAEVVTIDPPLAHLLLQRNPADENRKLSASTVAKYAADMAGGRWQGLNGQTIVISKDGYLNDGQHRLNAVISCGGSIPFTVVFGAERESRMTIDQNKVRTSGDYIGMAGIKNANKVAAIAALVHAYETNQLPKGSAVGPTHGDVKPTKALLHKFALARLPDIEQALRFADRKDVRKIATDTRIAGALYIIAGVVGFEDAEQFFAKFIDGDNLGKTSPAFQVRERLLQERMNGMVPIRRTLEIIFRGWNAYRRGERMSRLTLRNDLPEIEG
ncbi:hypothetical protein LB553_00970 [Mesorhizobium sp. CA8]|uniref:hypothetical protein n=1 Tax=Mesorhizobium sp. CA8 TaxID=2876637 RepID=UPI001CCFA448|nr:hypothetical protein [Mesorhizobium sp. CA8]MBZ9759459.1 hypothetical protein [Mesorhizobium sp. CA8]